MTEMSTMPPVSEGHAHDVSVETTFTFLNTYEYEDGFPVDHRHVGDPVDDALARLSEALVTELTGGHPERIRICANDTCRWVFYDTSRTARRRWCDMATCGNRAKQARHRARAKTVSIEPAPMVQARRVADA